MNEVTFNIKKMERTSEYMKSGRYKFQLKVAILLFSSLMIYSAGKRLGEFLFFVIN